MSEANIYQRINAVMKSVDYIKKDKEVDAPGQKYKAVTHDNVTAILRDHFVEHGIVLGVNQVKAKMLQMRDLKLDRKMHLYSGTYEVSLTNMDNPEDKHVGIVNAHAADNGDKAPGKCASYAVKVFLLKTFSIETGEDEEGRYHEAPLFSDYQKAQFDELIEEKNGLGFACFSQEMGEEAMKALASTFPAGKVSQGKKSMKELTQAGWDVINDYATQIKARIESNDPAVLELTDELQGTEKRLVANLLTDGEVAHLKKLKEIS